MTITDDPLDTKCENCLKDIRCLNCNDFCQRRTTPEIGPGDHDNGILGWAPRDICECEEFIVVHL